MNAEIQTAHDDLAFMRALVDAGENAHAPFGEGYLAAGLVYGAQMLAQAAQAAGWLSMRPLAGIALGLGPTVVFLIVLVWILRRHRRARVVGLVAKATGSVFGAAGIANLALAAVIGSVAWRHHSWAIWLIYPCAVFILQGAAWLMVFALRRRAWLCWVGVGWFIAAIAMGLSVDSLPQYILAAGLGFLVLMVVPGAVMIRLSRREA